MRNWTPKGFDSPLSIARYSRNVLFTKFGLLGAAVAVVLVMVITSLIHSDGERFNLAFSGVQTGGISGPPQMIRPRFQGVDAQNQPYTVSAELAEQKDADHVTLTEVNADIVMKAGEWVTLSANSADVAVKENRFVLNGDVHVFMDSGYEVTTETMQVDLNNGLGSGDVALRIQGPPGILRAQGFKALERGQRIVFTGPVHLTVYSNGEDL